MPLSTSYPSAWGQSFFWSPELARAPPPKKNCFLAPPLAMMVVVQRRSDWSVSAGGRRYVCRL